MSEVKLFCIPYSGGSAALYLTWKKSLPSNIHLFPVELAGHGGRINEPLYRDVDDAVNDIASYIVSNIQKDEIYAIAGHSMGSLLAYEVYYKLKEMGIHSPCHMFFSGRKAPQNIGHETEYYKKPDAEFLEIVYHYGGTTREVMENEELRKLFLPILRADFMIAEVYEWHEKVTKIDCNITVVNGNRDLSVLDSNMDEWALCTDKKCNIYTVAGAHFFILDNYIYMTNIITSQLKNC